MTSASAVVLALAGGVLLAGCASRSNRAAVGHVVDGPVDSSDAKLDAVAESDAVHSAEVGSVRDGGALTPLAFQGLRYEEAWGPCQPGATCSQTIELSAAGVLKVIDRGQTYSGDLEIRDRDLLIARAISGDTIADMRSGGGCLAAPDFTVGLRIDVAPGIYLQRMVTSCTASSLTALKLMIRHVAKRRFPAALIDLTGSFPPGSDQPSPIERVELPATFTSIQLEKRDSGCSDSTACGELIAVAAVDGSAVRWQQGIRMQWSGLALGILQALETAAMAPELHGILQMSLQCREPKGGIERLTIGIGEGVFLSNDVYGCEQDPVVRVREAVGMIAALRP